MEQHIMYVVKNESGEYLTEFSDYIPDWAQSPTLAKFYRTLSGAKRHANLHDAKVYQVTVTISDTPVSF
jgi:hypothetical protein